MSAILFYDSYCNGNHDGFKSKEFDSYELAMSWVREQSTGTSGVYTIENVKIYTTSGEVEMLTEGDVIW